MITIFKYKLLIERIQPLTIYEGAIFLTVKKVDNEIFIWALVNTEAPLINRTLVIYGTGHEIDKEVSNNLIYIKTVKIGIFMWHIFEFIE